MKLPRYCYWALGLALLLCAPALWIGLQLDDYFHWGLVTNQNPVLNTASPASPWGLFSFLDGDPGRVLDLTNLGLLPWWTFPEVKYAFWRPLTELTHGIDYSLWPEYPMLMHAHSLLYFAILLFCTFRLLQVVQGPGKALLWSVFLFALFYGHGVPAAWLANRNALLAGIFLVLTLHYHHQWRAQERGVLDLRAVLLFVAGLLCGELAVSTGFYILAYALLMDRGRWSDRLISVLPYALAGAIWLGVRAMLGYGAQGSGHYIDPLATPGLFLQLLAQRELDLLAGLFFSIPPEVGVALPKVRLWYYLAGAVLVCALAWPLLRQDRRARFWLAGALLCLLPVASTVPHSRLLLAASVGAAGFLGLWLAAWRDGQLVSASWLKVPVAMVAVVLIALKLGLSALLLPLEALSMGYVGDRQVNEGALSWQLPEDPAVTPVLINPPLSAAGGYINGVRAYHDLPIAPKTWLLASGTRPLTLTVINSRAFDLSSDKGLYDAAVESMLRGPQVALVAGDSLRLPGVIITVMEVEDNVPLRARFQFAQPFDSGAYRFYLWNLGEVIECRLPPRNTPVLLTLASASCDGSDAVIRQ